MAHRKLPRQVFMGAPKQIREVYETAGRRICVLENNERKAGTWEVP